MQNNKHSPCPSGKGTGRRTFRVQGVVHRTLPGQQDSPGGYRGRNYSMLHYSNRIGLLQNQHSTGKWNFPDSR